MAPQGESQCISVALQIPDQQSNAHEDIQSFAQAPLSQMMPELVCIQQICSVVCPAYGRYLPAYSAAFSQYQCCTWLPQRNAVLQVNPNIKKEKWSPAEDERLLVLYEEHGGSWAQISRHLEVSASILRKQSCRCCRIWLALQGHKLVSTDHSLLVAHRHRCSSKSQLFNLSPHHITGQPVQDARLLLQTRTANTTSLSLQ